MIIASLRSGIAQVWSHKRVVLPFYLANLGLGLLVMLPLAALVDDFVGNSMMREQLGVAMDYDVFFEFLLAPGGGLAGVQKIFLAAIVIYLLVALFFSGVPSPLCMGQFPDLEGNRSNVRSNDSTIR